MNALSISTPTTPASQLTAAKPAFNRPAPTDDQVADAKELQTAFTKFVGATVFGQMLSSMRSTVGEPAYFHGGQAEKMFQSQLDQAIADEMINSGASPFAKSMFEHQFPDAARTLKEAGAANQPSANDYDQLNSLRRF